MGELNVNLKMNSSLPFAHGFSQMGALTWEAHFQSSFWNCLTHSTKKAEAPVFTMCKLKLIHYSTAREQVLNRLRQPNTLITTLPFCFEAPMALLLWEWGKEHTRKVHDLLKRRFTKTKGKGIFSTTPWKMAAWSQNLLPHCSKQKILSIRGKEARQFSVEHVQWEPSDKLELFLAFSFSHIGHATWVNFPYRYLSARQNALD